MSQAALVTCTCRALYDLRSARRRSYNVVTS